MPQGTPRSSRTRSAGHRRLAGLVEQRVFVGRHHQERHEVLEHRAAPRKENRFAAAVVSRRPGQTSSPAAVVPAQSPRTCTPRFRSQQIVVSRVPPALVDVVTDRQQMARLVEEEVVLHLGEFAGLQRQAFDGRDPFPGAAARLREEPPKISQPLALLRGRVGAEPMPRWPAAIPLRVRPARAASGSPRAGKVADPILEGPAAKSRGEKRQFLEGDPALTGEGAAHHRRLALGAASKPPIISAAVAASRRGTAAPPRAWSAGNRMRTPDPSGIGQAGRERLLPQRPRESEGVAEPFEPSRSQDLVIGKREQTRPQRQQMAREISAVHRRDVERRQRFQGLGVVPVVEVAPVPFQGFHGAERFAVRSMS